MKNRSNRLNIDPETKKYYLEIRRKYADLRLSNSDLFSLALSMGRYYNIKEPLRRKVGFIRFETIPSELLVLIDLLSIDEFGFDNPEFFDDPVFGFDLAEEYANAGIKILVEKIYDLNEDFEGFLVKTIFELYEGLDFKKLE